MSDAAHDRGTGAQPTGAELAGAKILLVGINYAPEVTGIAPYTTAVSRHFVERGADVTVITGVPHYPEWRVPAGYGRLSSVEWLDGVRVIRVRHYVPRRQDVLRRGLFEASWLAGALVQAMRYPPDVVLAVSPPLAALPLARAVARRRSVPWGAVVQDLMGNAAARSGIEGGGRVAGRVAGFEGAQLAAADLVGVIGEGFGDSVVRMGVDRAKVRLLPNWTHVERVEVGRDEARRRLGWTDGGTVVVHTGNMGAKQGLENVVDAAALADERGSAVNFVLVGDGSQRGELERRARGLRRLRFVPPVSPEDYPYVLAAADLLLVNERPGMVEMSLPSKLTSYLAAGRPVVAAVPDDGWTAQLLRDTGAAEVVAPGRPAALLDVVLDLGADPVRRRGMSAAASSFAALRYGQDSALAKYCAFVGEMLMSRHAGEIVAGRT